MIHIPICRVFVSENVALHTLEQKVKFKCFDYSIESAGMLFVLIGIAS